MSEQNPGTPTFEDNFNQGTLRSDWLAAWWAFPTPHRGQYKPEYVDLNQGCLSLALNQFNGMGYGSEIQTRSKFGYGTYEFLVRAGSTSTSPSGQGQVVSGGITGTFNFVNDSETEIDFEVEGQAPTKLWMINRRGINNKHVSTTQVLAMEQLFRNYRFVWAPGSVKYYVDDVSKGESTTYVPSAPAHITLNHWGTDTPHWGGLATWNVWRYMYVKRVAFTPQA